MGTLAFVCAMPMEMRPLAKRLGLTKGEIGGVELRTGTLDGQPVVGFVTGMGTEARHRSTSTGCSPPCTPSASSCSGSPARWRTRRRSAPS